MDVPFVQESCENKLIYTQLFHQYTELVEAGIESRLRKAVDGFDMQVRSSNQAASQGCLKIEMRPAKYHDVPPLTRAMGGTGTAEVTTQRPRAGCHVPT
jgi:hypothetical protein